MKGSIRAVLGFLIVFGCVGGMETNPDIALSRYVVPILVGFGLLYSGVSALVNQTKENG